MLVLSRKKNESVVIDGGTVTVTVIEIRGDKVRLGFEHPQEMSVHRQEVWDAIQREREYSRSPSPPPATPMPVLPPSPVASPSAPSLDDAIETLRRAAERLSPEEAAAAKALLDAAKAKLT